MSGACDLTILMPCLDEAETLGACIGKAAGFLHRTGISGEILIADNGSTDGSQAIATALGARVIPVADRGYGAALLGGIDAARGRWIIMGDSDDSYDFAALDPFVAALGQGAQLVMGNRFRGARIPGAMPPLHRYLGNPVLTAIGRLLYRSPCRDFHCGLRGFDRAAIQTLGLHLTGMEFASEMVVKATLHGLRITEVPTSLAKDGRSRPPHLRSWRDGWRHLRFLLLLSPKWLFLYPGLAVSALGLAGMAALLPGPLHVGAVTFDIHTLLYAALALVVGYNSILFWIVGSALGHQVGLLPPDPGFVRLNRVISLERGLAAGAALLATGLVLGVAATLDWGATGLGNLAPSHSMRLAIPSATCILLATITATMSFFLSFLHLADAAGRKTRDPGAEPRPPCA